MKKTAINTQAPTNDKIIRLSLRKILVKKLKKYRKDGADAEIYEEFGVSHGIARIDFAIINGVMSGYEIKSDRDTLKRLPEQVEEFNAVFDELTLVVGKKHLLKAMNLVPDWWGIILTKIDNHGRVIFNIIREPLHNKKQANIPITQLLWRAEALKILEERNRATGVRSKPRKFIYERLAGEFSNINDLKGVVSKLLIARTNWRSGVPLKLGGG